MILFKVNSSLHYIYIYINVFIVLISFIYSSKNKPTIILFSFIHNYKDFCLSLSNTSLDRRFDGLIRRLRGLLSPISSGLYSGYGGLSRAHLHRTRPSSVQLTRTIRYAGLVSDQFHTQYLSFLRVIFRLYWGYISVYVPGLLSSIGLNELYDNPNNPNNPLEIM